MRAIMLAAGVGMRLGDYRQNGVQAPKVLLEIGGRSLLERHLFNLRRAGIEDLVVVTGHRAGDIGVALDDLDVGGGIRTVFNPRFREGSVVSLAAAADWMSDGRTVFLMDADVLYDPAVLQRLVATQKANCMLVDLDFEAGEEPVKVCIRDGEIVDFGKEIHEAHDFCGESVGFFKLSPPIARRLAGMASDFASGPRSEDMYEEVIRKTVRDKPLGTFGYEDVTGLPWIEIDFREDVERAETVILPRIEPP